MPADTPISRESEEVSMEKKLFTLEAMFAKHGDALLLHYGPWDDPKWILIDGGPKGVYRNFVRPHLSYVKWLYDYGPDEPLPLELMMVSHIDEDHIAGILDLLDEMDTARLEERPRPFAIQQLWHNSFDEVLGNKGSGHAASVLSRFAATADPDQEDDLPLSSQLDRETRAVIASTAQGRELRNAAKRLNIGVNRGWRGLVRRLSSSVRSVELGHGLELHVLGPAQEEIKKFQAKWDKDLKKLQKKEAEARAQALEDHSPFNLASISLLAEMDGQTMLLTGDARADHILDGLEEHLGRRPTPEAPYHVDLLKLPHHGSDKNVDDDFFASVTADNYVISGDGGFGNPEVATLEMLTGARGQELYTVHLTYFEAPEARRSTTLRKEALALVDRWIEDSKPAGCTVRYAERVSDPRAPEGAQRNAIEVDLLDPLYPIEEAEEESLRAREGRSGGGAQTAGLTADRGDRRDFLEDLIYRGEHRQRFTQQSPVMPDVWIHYGLSPHEPLDLLLTPDWNSEPAILARDLSRRLPVAGPKRWKKPAGLEHAIAPNQNAVAAKLWFHELLSAALPLSYWWRDSLCGGGRLEPHQWLSDSDKIEHLSRALEKDTPGYGEATIPADVVWFVRVAGVLAHLFLHRREAAVKVKTLERVRWQPKTLIDALTKCLPTVSPTEFDRPVSLFSVNRNRRTNAAIRDSVPAVKGDAAQRLFGVTGRGIRWAVIDSGIDATHRGFRRRDSAGRAIDRPFGTSGSGRRKKSAFSDHTRVRATFDFRNIRDILSLDHKTLADADPASLLALVRDPDPGGQPLNESLATALRSSTPTMVDWKALEPFLRIDHSPSEYYPPVNPHGTHVAGIIGADCRRGPESKHELTGMCPEIELYDFRVLRDDGTGDEFSIMAAMQFIRHFNTRFEYVAIHGVNLSFSIDHDVSNYACGQTPVCVEAERLVGSGIAVVTAAGNSGRARYLTAHRSGVWQTDEGFRTVSITDPGNAESVITVGATHRREPHTYGVSYFSSRGPTGDGRVKPDLVAPGEKIRSTTPDNEEKVLDGTSMAAPHVSGAAALLMSRHSEFIGDPQRIKRILCDSATDLGRERYFQGEGLLDILRALQSV